MKVRFVLLMTSALTAMGAPAFAADTGIEQITVTAERRSESILRVPATIQALTGQQLKNSGINNLTDIQLVSPGYTVTDSSGYTMIFIRGIGNSNFVGPESNVATYVDDVPRLWGQFANTFVDVSRVEVLKGAQGGLYGRNATGGVVSVVTEQPSTDEFFGHAQVSYGEHNTFKAAAFVNMPLTDTLAWTVAASRESHDAYVTNVAIKDPYSAANFPTGTFIGAINPAFASVCGGIACSPVQSAAIMNSGVNPHNLGSQDTYAVDSKLLWQPVENFKVTLAGDYYFKDDSGGNQNYTASPDVTQTFLAENFASFGVNAVLPPNFEQTVTKKFQTATGDNLFQKLKDWGTSLTAVWHTPIADVTAISAYRGNHSDLDADLCACSVPSGTALVDIRRQFYYEELRLVSNTDGPFQWLGGATFLGDHQSYDTHVSILPPLADLHSAAGHDLVQNWTVYGQVGYDILPDLNVTGSLRWERETNTFAATFPVIPGVSGTASEGLEKLIPSATLSYKLDDGTLYARWARGVQSGGVNPVASPAFFRAVGAPLSDGSTFGPEKVDTYEIGYKQALMDNSIHLTGDVFYNKFSGLQESAHAQAAFQQELILAIVNAGSADTYGAEGSIDWQVIDPLRLGLNVGYLHAEFLNFRYGFNGPFLVPTDLDHTQMLNSPKWQLSLTADLDQPLDDRFNLVAHAVESHLSSQLFDQSVGFGIPAATVPGYWLTNLRVGVKTSDDKYELDVFANNLFNQAYFTFGSVSAASGDLYGWGNPRVVGVELNVNF